MSLIDIYCVADHELDATMWVDSLLTPGDVGIAGVADLVAKVQARCAGGDRVRELRVVGHGDEWGQYFGADWVNEQTATHRHRADFACLRGLFGPGGFMTLGGCDVGEAAALLRALSGIVGVPVQGFMAKQYPLFPGDEGRRRRCSARCEVNGSEAWEHVDRVLDPARERLSRTLSGLAELF
jgi:hypothetical protein